MDGRAILLDLNSKTTVEVDAVSRTDNCQVLERSHAIVGASASDRAMCSLSAIKCSTDDGNSAEVASMEHGNVVSGNSQLSNHVGADEIPCR